MLSPCGEMLGVFFGFMLPRSLRTEHAGAQHRWHPLCTRPKPSLAPKGEGNNPPTPLSCRLNPSFKWHWVRGLLFQGIAEPHPQGSDASPGPLRAWPAAMLSARCSGAASLRQSRPRPARSRPLLETLESESGPKHFKYAPCRLERGACLKWARDLVIAASRRHLGPAKGTAARLQPLQNAAGRLGFVW